MNGCTEMDEMKNEDIRTKLKAKSIENLEKISDGMTWQSVIENII